MGPKHRVIWLSNLNYEDYPSTLRPAQCAVFSGVASRVPPRWINSEQQNVFDYSIWMIVMGDMLRNHPMAGRGGFKLDVAQDVLNFFCTKAPYLQELSPRFVNRLAITRHDQEDWQIKFSEIVSEKVRHPGLILPQQVPQILAYKKAEKGVQAIQQPEPKPSVSPLQTALEPALKAALAQAVANGRWQHTSSKESSGPIAPKPEETPTDPEPLRRSLAPITWSHQSDEWGTPQELFDFLATFFAFDVDVAATAENAKCKEFWTKEDDGLQQRWAPEKTFWMNPPYSQAGKWVRKADEAAAAGAIVVGLLPNRSATGWYKDFVVPNAHIIQLHGRAKFIPGHKPIQNSSAPFASILVIWPKSAASRLRHVLTPAEVGVMSLSVAA
jgi:phage N-6-adenine-methyltransferase